MPGKVFVLGTYDQSPEALFEIDLMRYLDAVGVPAAAVVFKRSSAAQNPIVPVVSHAGSGTLIHVSDFNDSESVAAIAACQPDLLLYAGGRDLLRRELLASAPLGCLGGHYGRLPEVRGMATVEWSVMLGVAPTVAIQRISPGIDTGDVLMQARVPLVPGDTYTTIRERSYFLTKVMLALCARGVTADGWQGVPQQLDCGRQYYRLAADTQRRADRALETLLSTLRSSPSNFDEPHPQ